ncbi:MAG: glycosyltransferase family 2 protein [Bacteroidota bacterium]|nr:glycosyltransferase family 2 protein [Candidatus Kapabacteria bacterium]MDW8219569.1 glycosyltransferase family 2 protein [Bacteroidota bacterium]
MPKLSVIVPCYYNQDNIPITTSTLIENERLFDSDVEFEYVFVDDGSHDATYQAILEFHQAYPEKVKAIKLAKNVGSHNAILAGLHYATGDACVILAADLQDPPELIPEMYTYWKQGFKLVLANRTDREESFWQRLFATTFHRLIKRLALPNVPEGGFDLALFDKVLQQEIVRMSEKNTHILYLLVWLGYAYVNIPYTRRKRDIGKSRWTMAKKLKLLIDSFIAFSFAPIRIISLLGLLLGGAALMYGGFVIVARLLGWIPYVQGWSSLMVVLLLVSAFQMIALGIIGEYIWRVLDAIRSRPNFIVERMDIVKHSPQAEQK